MENNDIVVPRDVQEPANLVTTSDPLQRDRMPDTFLVTTPQEQEKLRITNESLNKVVITDDAANVNHVRDLLSPEPRSIRPEEIKDAASEIKNGIWGPKSEGLVRQALINGGGDEARGREEVAALVNSLNRQLSNNGSDRRVFQQRDLMVLAPLGSSEQHIRSLVGRHRESSPGVISMYAPRTLGRTLNK
jgi:hypothetical protein